MLPAQATPCTETTAECFELASFKHVLYGKLVEPVLPMLLCRLTGRRNFPCAATTTTTATTILCHTITPT
jgi:hypothetical protein